MSQPACQSQLIPDFQSKWIWLVWLAVEICFASRTTVATADPGEPPTGRLIATGITLGVPTYAIGVILHEGSHALAATLLGANVKQFSVIPGRYGPQRNFFFGYVRVTGLRGVRQRTFFWLAPKLTDVILLGGFAALSVSKHLPANRYLALSLTVFATGLWVDFSKDIISTRRANDVVKTYNAHGLTNELVRFPFRLAHAALSIGAGYAIYRGFSHVFENRANGAPMTIMAPFYTGRY